MKVLLVEDSPTQAEFYKEVLQEVGLSIIHARDGREALDMALEYQPDLIILDVNLPVLNGIQVCARLQRTSETQHIPIIMLTRLDKPEDAMAGLSAGAVDYIAKDEFAVETLLASLEQLGIANSEW
jgi:DNA-binding response OmpR family regulator